MHSLECISGSGAQIQLGETDSNIEYFTMGEERFAPQLKISAPITCEWSTMNDEHTLIHTFRRIFALLSYK